MVDASHLNETIVNQAAEEALSSLVDGFWVWDMSTNGFNLHGRLSKTHGPDGTADPLSMDWFRSLIPAQERERFDSRLFENLNKAEVFSFEHRLMTPSGEDAWYETRAQAIRENMSGAPIVYGITHSIDEHVSQRHRAEKENRRKTEFLANMSHELRTPLNGVLGMAQLLERTILDERQDQLTRKLKTSGQALRTIIDDLLDISRIETGVMTFEAERLDFAAMLTAIEDSAAGLIEDKPVQFSTVMDPSLRNDRTYLGDQNRITQVLLNLTGNAIKFTDSGTVTVRIEKNPEEYFLFSIEDTGPGIELQHQTGLFKRFSRGGQTTRPGTGLGLAICKELVEAMGGSIALISEPGQGTRVSFQLSLERSLHHSRDTAPEEQGASSAFPGEKNHLEVLLAEDNPINREVIEGLVAVAGRVNLTMVETGQAAIDALSTQHFDLVLMDIDMPVLGGDEAIKKIRASNAAWRDVPIIVISADALVDQRANFLTLGADHYLPKPIDAEVFLLVIEQFRPAVPTRRSA